MITNQPIRRLFSRAAAAMMRQAKATPNAARSGRLVLTLLIMLLTATTTAWAQTGNIADCELRGIFEGFNNGYGVENWLERNVQVWYGDTQLECGTDYYIETEWADPYVVDKTYNATIVGTGDWEGSSMEFTFTYVVPHHTVVFIANGGTSTMDDDIVENDDPTYDLPECRFTAPSCMVFDYWEVSYEDMEEDPIKQPGQYFTAPYIYQPSDIQTITVTAHWRIADEIPYIDADGKTQKCTNFTLLNSDNMPTTLGAGWYVAAGNINYTSTVKLSGSGNDVHLILADGCQMNVGTSDGRINNYGISGGSFNLTIYGQSEGSGALNVYTAGYGINAYTITINGGHVTANAEGDYKAALVASFDVTINGGTVSATATGTEAKAIRTDMGNFNFNGGNVTTTATGTEAKAIYAYGKHYNFNCRSATDRITIGSTGLYAPDANYTATFNGVMTDGSGFYYGTVTDLSTLSGKTLQPAYTVTYHLGGGTNASGNPAFLLPGGEAVTLADATHDDYDFSGWYDNSGLTGDAVTTIDADGNKELWAKWTISVDYVDASGNTHTQDNVIPLDGSETTLNAGWYVVGATEVNFDHTLNLSGDVTLILKDGCQMNIGTSESRINSKGFYTNNIATLTIYGQSEGSGALSIYTSSPQGSFCHGIYVSAITINGGHVTADTGGFATFALATISNGDIAINGGTVSATTTGNNAYAINANGNFYYNGGNVTLNAASANAIRAVNGNYYFNWRNVADRITIGSTGLYATDTKTATFSKAFIDEDGNIYSGTVSVADINARAAASGNGLTLQPAISYIDANGSTQYCTNYTVLTSGNMPTSLGAGWYVVTGEINYTGTVTLNGNSNVHLILADGCQMNVGTSESRINGDGIKSGSASSLTIYGQSTGSNMGTLSVYITGFYDQCIRSYTLTINGGRVIANAEGTGSHALTTFGGDLTINGGIVNANATGNEAFAILSATNFNFNGGIVTTTATGTEAKAINTYGKHYNFNWRNATDRITIGTTGLYADDGTTATFSKAFIDEDGNIYSGTLTGSDALATLAGKTLTAYTPTEGYYLVGTMTNWGLNANYKLTENTSAQGEYMIQNVPLTNGTGIKAIHYNASTGDWTWYPGGDNNNYNITEDGIYNIYFRPNGNSAWSYHYLYVQKVDNPTVSVTFAPEGFATYYNGQCDVTLPDGVKARVVTDSGDKLTYLTIADGDESNNIVPAGTAVMLQTAASTDQQTKTLTLSAKAAAAYTGTNLLHGSDYQTTTTGGAKYYKMTYNTSGQNFGWYWGAAEGAAFTIPGHKAWLALPVNAPAFLGLPDYETTGVTPLLSPEGEDEGASPRGGLVGVSWYTIDGRKLNGKPTAKGLYIYNGKKIIVK